MSLAVFFRVFELSETDCRTTLRTTGLFGTVLKTSPFSFGREKTTLRCSVKSFMLMVAASEVMCEERYCTVLRGRKNLEGEGRDRVVLQGPNGLLLVLLASAVPGPSQDVTIERELTYLSRQPGRVELVYFQRNTECTCRYFCGKAIELLAGFAVRG